LRKGRGADPRSPSGRRTAARNAATDVCSPASSCGLARADAATSRRASGRRSCRSRAHPALRRYSASSRSRQTACRVLIVAPIGLRLRSVRWRAVGGAGTRRRSTGHDRNCARDGDALVAFTQPMHGTVVRSLFGQRLSGAERHTRYLRGGGTRIRADHALARSVTARSALDPVGSNVASEWPGSRQVDRSAAIRCVYRAWR
jgi:hypothetical protein